MPPSIYEVDDTVCLKPNVPLSADIETLLLVTGWKGTETFTVKESGQEPGRTTIIRNKHAITIDDNLIELVKTKHTLAH